MRLAPQSFGKVHSAMSALFSRRRTAAWALEVLVGHVNFCALANRTIPSCLRTVYAFIQRHYITPVVIWQEVRSSRQRMDFCR